MQRHELRKLITTFLVLALLAGSASLAINSFVRQQSEGPAAKIAQQETTQVPKIGDKALVEDLASTRIEGYDLAAEFSPSTDPDDNYTDGLAKSLAYNFVKANPEGPDLAGGTGILPPGNLQETMDSYVIEAALSPTTYAIDKSRVKIAKNYTQEQAAAYLETVIDVFDSASSTRGLAGIIARSGSQPDVASVQATNFLIADAQERLYDTVVPEPAAKLQEAALSYLELNRKLTDLDYTTDPLKAVVFATKFPEFRALEETRLRLEVNNLEQHAPEMFAQAQTTFTIATLLGINEAHAVIPVADWLHKLISIINGTAQFGTWSQLIADNIKSIALQILKNQLVGRLIQQTVKWVQGGGKPQFITNWKAFLKDSAIGAANQFINTVSPHLCQNLRAFTTDFLRSNVPNSISGSRDPYQQFNCTLDQIVQTVKDFYDDFISGGFLALAALVLQPQNNSWGALIIAHEAAIAMASQAQGAADANAQANRGYTGLTRCVNFDLIIIDEPDLASMQSDPDYDGKGPRGCFDSGAYGKCEIRMCKPDGRQQTTPGGFVADSVAKAVTGGPLENIVNANDLGGLVAVLVDAAISKLTNFAIGGLLGLFGGSSDSGPGGSGGSGGGNGGSGGSGGGITPGDLAALKAQTTQLIASYQTRVTQASTENASWSGLAASTRPLLSSVIPTCPAFASDATQRLGAMDRIAGTIALDQNALTALSAQIASTSAAIAAATDALTVSNLVASLDTINSSIANLTTRSATRNGQLESLKNDAETDLADRACSTPLTTLDE